MSSVPEAAWAIVKRNPKVWVVYTLSGYGLKTFDPEGRRHVLPLAVSDADLGAALLDALAHSRFVPPQDQPDLSQALLDPKAVKEQYDKMVEAEP